MNLKALFKKSHNYDFLLIYQKNDKNTNTEILLLNASVCIFVIFLINRLLGQLSFF